MQPFKHPLSLTATSLLLLLVACSSTPPTNVNLTEAERAVERANNDAHVSRYAPEILQEANNSLQMAQESWREEGQDQRERVDHLSYLAKQQALIGLERAATEMAKAEIKTADDRRNELVLQSREREIQRLKQQAANLQNLVKDMEAKQTERGLVLTIGDILFDFDKAKLNPGGRKAVENLASWLQENPERNILIEGHTDAQGAETYNRELSKERAASVKQTLTSFGVAASRIMTTGYGEQYPVANNKSSAGRQQNRRVEVVIAEAGEVPEYREEVSQSTR